MAGLKVYVDLMSQPARAVALFVKLTKIPHELCEIQIKKGEHMDSDYLQNVNRFGRVPAIIDNGENIVESVAILRYLSRKYNVDEHWYPKDVRAQAKVDEYLEWQHIGVRVPLSMYFQTKFLIPMLAGQPSKPGHVENWKGRMEASLDDIENIWLEKNQYLAGNTITIADLIGICEVDQPRMAGYDPGQGRPRLAAWLHRVRTDLTPHYQDVTKILSMVVNKFKGEPPANLSKL